MTITAPAATVDQPLRIAFRLEASAVPAGHDHSTVQLFRNRAVVPECTTPGGGVAAPNPCIDQRAVLGDGDILLTALTSHASVWEMAVVTPYAFGGFQQPVDVKPTPNKAKAGSAIPVKFSLGGDRGLGIFASGYPRLVKSSCSSASTDAVEQTVSAGASSLTYDATAGRYSYVWKTSSAWAGTCGRLQLRFADGSTQEALFDFRK